MANTLIGLLHKHSIQIKNNGDIIYYPNGRFHHQLWEEHSGLEIIPENIRNDFEKKVYQPLMNYWTTKYHNMGDTANSIADTFGSTILPISPISHEGNEVYFMQQGEVIYYLTFKYNSGIISLGQFYLGAMRYIHSEPKNKWLIAVSKNMDKLLATELSVERLEILQDLAKPIPGIGEKTIFETLLEIDPKNHA